jgi:hypothetical protein
MQVVDSEVDNEGLAADRVYPSDDDNVHASYNERGVSLRDRARRASNGWQLRPEVPRVFFAYLATGGSQG